MFKKLKKLLHSLLELDSIEEKSGLSKDKRFEVQKVEDNINKSIDNIKEVEDVVERIKGTLTKNTYPITAKDLEDLCDPTTGAVIGTCSTTSSLTEVPNVRDLPLILKEMNISSDQSISDLLKRLDIVNMPHLKDRALTNIFGGLKNYILNFHGWADSEKRYADALKNNNLSWTENTSVAVEELRLFLDSAENDLQSCFENIASACEIFNQIRERNDVESGK